MQIQLWGVRIEGNWSISKPPRILFGRIDQSLKSPKKIGEYSLLGKINKLAILSTILNWGLICLEYFAFLADALKTLKD